MAQKFYSQPSRVSTSSGSIVHFCSRGLDSVSKRDVVLVLIHGYPQSSFMYRHLIPLLPPELALFVPDLPGYGDSTPSSTAHDKATIGGAVLEALQLSLPAEGPTRIILLGHDRGARVCHRLAVDAKNYPFFEMLSVIFLDIVPTLAQWESFANSKGVSGGFHWPFLANVELATTMIMSQGGGWWCRQMIERWAGRDEKRLKLLTADDAMDTYCKHFDKESVVRASCEDYRSGAFEDVDLQKEDQEKGRKVTIPTLVIFSQNYLGARYDVGKVWAEWVTPGVTLKSEGIGEGTGHFIPEEAPQELADIVGSWLQQFK